MILHLMYDEKVISRTIQYFEEALPGQNRFIIMIPFLGYQCKYVDIQSDKVFYVKYGSKDFWKYVGNVNQYSNVICHLLGMNAIRFVLKTRHPLVTWMVWGADIYGELLPARGFLLYDRESKQHILAKNQRLSHKFKVRLKRHIKAFMQIRAGKIISNACIGVGDYQLLLQYYPEFQHLKRKLFFYYPIDFIISESLRNKGIIGDDIMVGNSASLSGNHFRVFKLLSELNLKQRKVIVPVSYGECKEQIIEEGQRLLGNNFVPLIDFLPLQEYNEFLLQSQTFIYGHYRQEAWGNIVIALYLGATVFLESCNPLMVDIKALGCVCFSMDQLNEKLHYKLTEVEKNKNREIIERNFNHKRLMQCIRETFGTS